MTWESLDKISLTCTTWGFLTVLPGTSHLKTRHVASQLQHLPGIRHQLHYYAKTSLQQWNAVIHLGR